jgi:hypothetical protein
VGDGFVRGIRDFATKELIARINGHFAPPPMRPRHFPPMRPRHFPPMRPRHFPPMRPRHFFPQSLLCARRSVSSLRSTTSLQHHIVPTLRPNRPSSANPPPTFPFLHPDIVPPPPTLEEISPAGKLFKLTWPRTLRNIFIVKKRRDEKVTLAAIKFAQ